MITDFPVLYINTPVSHLGEDGGVTLFMDDQIDSRCYRNGW